MARRRRVGPTAWPGDPARSTCRNCARWSWGRAAGRTVSSGWRRRRGADGWRRGLGPDLCLLGLDLALVRWCVAVAGSEVVDRRHGPAEGSSGAGWKTWLTRLARVEAGLPRRCLVAGSGDSELR
uniref:Uncharacterized protein n=1 Tax=Leersia perrieri TaxID=77586 RepID=A0A0D9VZW9_9ORYZ